MRLDRETLAAEVKAFVEGIIQGASLDLHLELDLHGEEALRVDLEGPDSGLLLADNARLLYAINHLLNQIYYRRSREGHSFVVDCNNYRADRAAELQLMAAKAAEKAKLSGTQISLQPMPATDRRIIHLTLAEEDGVHTQSEGSGQYRRVLISPGG